MSENPMGGYGAPGIERPAEAPAAGRDPKLLIGGGAALVLVAAVGGFLLLGGGGGSTPAASPAVVHHVVRTPLPTVTAAPVAVGKPVVVVRTFNGDVGRDPFKPLIVPVTPKPPAPTKSAAATTGPAAPGTVVIPTVGPGGVVQPTTLPTVAVSALPTAAPRSIAAPVLVVLKSISARGGAPMVVVTYSGKSYVLKTGAVAGGDLKVVAIAPDDGTATFQLGDQRFDLHVGQSYVD